MPEGKRVLPRMSQAAVTLEQAQVAAVGAAHGVVVERDAPDPAVLRQYPRLRLDLLGSEDALHRGEQRIPVEQLEVPGELFDAVDLTPALDLHGHADAGGVA